MVIRDKPGQIYFSSALVRAVSCVVIRRRVFSALLSSASLSEFLCKWASGLVVLGESIAVGQEEDVEDVFPLAWVHFVATGVLGGVLASTDWWCAAYLRGPFWFIAVLGIGHWLTHQLGSHRAISIARSDLMVLLMTVLLTGGTSCSVWSSIKL